MKQTPHDFFIFIAVSILMAGVLAMGVINFVRLNDYDKEPGIKAASRASA